jgi:very-short-patch-repair endonuclease
METRIRLAIEDEGLPLPVLQHPVGPYSLDLSYPAVLLAVEHNGGDHLTAARALRDLEREAYLTRRGWRIVRFGAAQVYSHPRLFAARIRKELVLSGRARGLPLTGVVELITARAA